MTGPSAILELQTHWLNNFTLGVIVRGADELIYQGKLALHDPHAVKHFTEDVLSNCESKQLEGINGEVGALRVAVERVLVTGCKHKARGVDPSNANDRRPRINYEPRNLFLAVRRADEEMSALNPPVIYQRSGTIVSIVNERMVVTERGMRKSQKDESPAPEDTHAYRQIIKTVPEPVLRCTLSEQLVFRHLRKDGWRDGEVPPQVVGAYYKGSGWHLPVLQGITNVPVLHDDGTVHATPGYDSKSGFSLTDACRFEIPDNANWVKARRGLDEIKRELFSDFPFPEPYHRSAALAALFQRAIQPSFNPAQDEVLPGYLITSPIRGSGKGKIVKVISMVVDGQLPFLTTPPDPRDKAEWRKLLTTLLLEGHPTVLIDNIETGTNFGNSVLDAAMTAGKHGDRILGVTKSGEMLVNCTFFASGNNLGLRADAARRFVPIHLDAKTERPDLRGQWRHVNLVQWAKANRERLISLVFTVLRAHALAGRPGIPPVEEHTELRRRHFEDYPFDELGAWQPLEERPPRLGSFERWDDLVRAPLLWLGEPDPCAGMQEMIDTADEDTQTRANLLQALWDVFGEQEFLARDAHAQAERGRDEAPLPDPSNPLRAVMPKNLALYHALKGDDPGQLSPKKVGRRLQKVMGAIWNGLVLKRSEGRAREVLWKIGNVDTSDEPPF